MSIPPSVIIENSQGNKRRHDDEDGHDDRKKVKIPTLFDCNIKFEELEIIRRIAEGGFGIVYKVLWNKGKQNEQMVAIKVVSNTATQQSERDFKREHSKNVLIHDGNPLLADFGLSKSLLETNEGHISEVRGIQAYVDPKLLDKTLNSSYTHTKRSDIYSFGVVMWEIYTCRLPFNGRNDKHLTIELCFGEREKPVDGMPISYKEIYEKCWEHNPLQISNAKLDLI
ncbi:6906_t:CDS:2 [Cetraspora pellucida]|uniref:6906_t:CDS:1 n=1 Tax=Cetraspora pellucida TaxID=1433469 RepID=A0ACA9NXJ0_9GLOM|nr:6906_t:CDS:2 [Cetraspora pellucida]